MKLFKNNHGDTIIEVLVSIAALSLILSVSYALTNRNTQTFRQAQERGEALKATESQIELLRHYLSTNDPSRVVPPNGAVFCMVRNDVTGAVSFVDFGAATPPDNAQADNFSTFSTRPGCVSGLYNRYIVRNGDTFTAHTRWFSATGNNIDESTMAYRTYPDTYALNSGAAIDSTGCAPEKFLINPIAQICQDCPEHYESPGLAAVACTPIPPKITVLAQMITQNSDNTTPSCTGGNALVNLGGATITLSGNSTTTTGVTVSGPPSTATFSRLAFNQAYTATLAAPGGTNPDGQTKYISCGDSASVTTPAQPAPMPPGPVSANAEWSQTTAPALKFIPRCYSVDEYTLTDNGENHVHRTAVNRTENWLYHEHPLDSAPYVAGGAPAAMDGRYNFGTNAFYDQTETHGGTNYTVRYIYDSSQPKHSTGWYYTQWVFRPVQVFDHWNDVDHWHPKWENVKTGSHYECPS
jgi:hypothetical protein